MFRLKSTLFAIGALFAADLALAAPAEANTSISCPLSQARRTITTDLPTDWWTTPMVSSLSDTKVMTIGDEPALVCVYGASGSIQRKAPTAHSCTARTGGFTCQPIFVALPVPGIGAPQTYSTGPISIKQTFLFDLDKGRQTSTGADVWFQAETADLLYLVPRNGARLAVGDRSNRGFSGCQSARFTPDRVSLRDVPVGSYVCAKTNEGRISQFRVNTLSGSPKVLKVGYTTWK
ncbi:MAG: hypothetical protein AAGF19_02815 [Pseudomonadota bacterium]